MCVVCNAVVEIAYKMQLHTYQITVPVCCVKVLGDELDQETAKIVLSVRRI